MNEDEEAALDEYGGGAWSIWGEFRYQVSLWNDIYLIYWGLGKGEPREGLDESLQKLARSQHSVANVALKMIRSLSLSAAAENRESVNPTASDLKFLRKLFRDFSKTPVAKDWVGLQLADDITKELLGADDRAFRLLGVMQGKSLSSRAAGYLSRVAALYVRGLELEVGMMCGATLEAALLSRLEDDIDGNKEPPSLERLIQLAGKTGALTGRESASNRRGWRARTGTPLYRAERIRRMRNFIIHEFASYPTESGAIQDSFEAIRELSLTLSELFPPPTFK